MKLRAAFIQEDSSTGRKFKEKFERAESEENFAPFTRNLENMVKCRYRKRIFLGYYTEIKP